MFPFPFGAFARGSHVASSGPSACTWWLEDRKWILFHGRPVRLELFWLRTCNHGDMEHARGDLVFPVWILSLCHYFLPLDFKLELSRDRSKEFFLSCVCPEVLCIVFGIRWRNKERGAEQQPLAKLWGTITCTIKACMHVNKARRSSGNHTLSGGVTSFSAQLDFALPCLCSAENSCLLLYWCP